MVKKNIRIILSSKPCGEKYSIESGVADNKKHFDHHGKWSRYASPCNNEAIQEIKEENASIRITHIDADTFIGLKRLLGQRLPDVNMEEVEYIDNHGTKGIRANNRARVYMAGLEVVVNKIGFPRVSESVQDVTEYIYEISKYSDSEILRYGKEAISKEAEAERKCIKKRKKGIAYYRVKEEYQDAFNASTGYKNGIKVVLVYYEKYKTLSLYGDPVECGYQLGNRKWGAIEFAGHKLACGSNPRERKVSEEEIQSVWDALQKEIN